MRDPQRLGERLLSMKTMLKIEKLSHVDTSVYVEPYKCDMMSNDPALHHSQTPQVRPE
jgi:hypothetical protein